LHVKHVNAKINSSAASVIHKDISHSSGVSCTTVNLF